ncbi:MAG TPA: hypothetical protein VN444_02755, partial [Verrucomicrobiae bacterium]|nr:hypothetical protein [Verrucomicrobiae bacterium]
MGEPEKRELPSGMLSDLKGRRGAIIAGWLVYAFASLGFGAASQPWHIWALIGFYGLYFGLAEGRERALTADLVSPDRQAYGLWPLSLLYRDRRLGRPFSPPAPHLA